MHITHTLTSNPLKTSYNLFIIIVIITKTLFYMNKWTFGYKTAYLLQHIEGLKQRNKTFPLQQRWDQVTVFQVQVESQVFAVKSQVKSQVKAVKSVKSQVKSQVQAGKSKSSLKSRAMDSSQVSSLTSQVQAPNESLRKLCNLPVVELL